MMRSLRLELTQGLSEFEPRRKPSVRRSDERGWLLATDVPQLISPDALDALRKRLHGQGWSTELRAGWLLLDHPIEHCIPDKLPELTGEAACVCSLLERHPGGQTDPEMVRCIARASEQGEEKLQRFCAELHHEFAVRLRKHQMLPDQLIPYLLCAFCKEMVE